jgi:amidase
LGASIAHAHRHHYPAHANNYGADLAATIEAGQKVTAGDVVSAQIIARTYRAQLESVYRVVDLVLVPVLKWPTPLLGEFERLLREDPVAALAQLQFTIPFNVSGNPTITLPAGFTDGMPVAVQIVGPHFSEGLLFRAGHVFQCATDWHLTKPPNRVCVTT